MRLPRCDQTDKLLAQVACVVQTDPVSGDAQIEDATAVRLALALKRLRARLREASSWSSAELSLSQLSILSRLFHDGPATAAALAAAEHVSQQAVAQSIATLKSAGLVCAARDPRDGRKSQISITDVGGGLRQSIIASRNSWLSRAVETTIDAGEKATLDRAIDLLERLADADT